MTTAQLDLKTFDIIVINSSAGKDSQAMLDEMFGRAMLAGVMDRLVVVHADLRDMEWQGTAELAERQAQHYRIRFIKCGRDETILDYTLRRGKWPSNKQRWCTSDFKRAPIQKVFTSLVCELHEGTFGYLYKARPVRILNCMGIRAQESSARAKKQAIKLNESASNGKREVIDYLPIHDWSESQVWDRIAQSGVEHHPAYDLGMPRLSCVFCIFAPKAALKIAGQHNMNLLDRYIAVEQQTGHTFRHEFSLSEVKAEIMAGDIPKSVESWSM